MTKTFFIILLLGTTILLVSVFLWLRATPIITVTPEKALIDQPVEILISNLKPLEHIKLEASCKNKDNDTWVSHATFQADDNGIVNVSKQASISGSYNGVDPMGLFWSMMPIDKDLSKRTIISKHTLNIGEVLLSVFSNNKLKTSKTIYRMAVSPDVEKRNIREHGVVGSFFYPKNMNKGAGVIVVPGSNGGIPENISQMLASHGYAILALGYFNAEGLPKSLSNIPLECFQNAMQWLKKQPQVDGNRIALMGHSRGGELVLLLASMFPGEMASVIAYGSPTLVLGDFFLGDFSPKEKAGWTFKNKPIQFMPVLSEAETLQAAKEGHIASHKGTLEDPLEERDTFVYAMKKFSQNIEAATIKVENIRCPILIISGEDDKMFPSTLHGNMMMKRLDKNGSTIIRKHIHYPDAGHNIFLFPYMPSIDLPVPFGPVWGLLGGTPKGNAHAIKESWQETLNFLKETLR